MNITKDAQKGGIKPSKQRSYNEIVAYLDSHWKSSNKSSTLDRMKQLDTAFNGVSKKINTILVAGTNGKSLTLHFATKLLQAEGLNVGLFSSPHILNYNERISYNQTCISNKEFTELGNEVITMAESNGIQANSSEILTMMSLLYFNQNKVDVALLEVNEGGLNNATNICDAKIVSVTRVTAPDTQVTEEEVCATVKEIMGTVKKNTWIFSGDQNKSHIKLMQAYAEECGGQWVMPIRKLVPLNYPFEQLHGRCAALAERIADIYVNNFAKDNPNLSSKSLLLKQKGRRGRPTIEAKRASELNPKRTIEQFWKETLNTLPGKFQLLDKEKPTVLLDNAHNLDAFSNLLLGIRLLHYQRPLQGLSIVIGAARNTLYNEEFLKLIRYFFKKTSGQLFICPIQGEAPGAHEETSWDAEAVANDAKTIKIKAHAFATAEEAFKAAKESVNERHGLVVITGSQSIINSYWNYKGIKKLN